MNKYPRQGPVERKWVAMRMPQNTMVLILAIGVCLCLVSTAFAQSPAANDYSRGESWLCRPDRLGACDVDLSTTIIAENGALTRETWKPDADAPVDCFYVYPTVSTDPTPNSDMTADPAELNVIRQ